MSCQNKVGENGATGSGRKSNFGEDDEGTTEINPESDMAIGAGLNRNEIRTWNEKESPHLQESSSRPETLPSSSNDAPRFE